MEVSESGGQSNKLQEQLQAQIAKLTSDMNAYKQQIAAATAAREQIEQQTKVDHAGDAVAVVTETGKLDQFKGEWINTDRKTGGIIRLAFRTEGNRHLLHPWGNCQPHPCDWNEVDSQPYGPTVSADLESSTQALVAQFVTTFSRTLLIARPAGPTRLVIETFTVFTDSSRRTPYHGAYTMEPSTAAK
jgi:hypothetical protein